LPCLVCRTREYRRGRRILSALANGRPATPQGSQRRPPRRRRNCRARMA
jgi:hypothetical protein